MTNRGIVRASIASALLLACAWVATAQENTLYNFKGTNSGDGSVPACTLIFDAAGNMYGTTSSGGTVGEPHDIYGTAFIMTPGPNNTWSEHVMYSFGAYSNDGIGPSGGLVFDKSGNLYGTTSLGGANGAGTVYELAINQGVLTESVLYSFGATSTDGSQPGRGSLIFDAQGNLYGTTTAGGSSMAGTVFELSPGSGGAWTEKILYNLGTGGTGDALSPTAGLAFDADGNLYGTSQAGGSDDSGTVFELSPGTGGTWTETVLHSFAPNGTDGSDPLAGVTLDAQGNLYGTTKGGGTDNLYGGYGVVYELSPVGGGVWSEQILYSFLAQAGVGDYPEGGVVFDAAGNLYTTASGGLDGFGQVIELSPSPTGWTEKALYKFSDTPDGHFPENGLTFDTQGNLYGTTSTGGAESADFGLGGTVYQIPGITTANPTFSPGGGAYSAGQPVTLSDTTAGATIYYSINGGPAIKYNSTAIEVSASESIQAYATSPSLPQSQITTAEYQIGSIAATPVFSIPAGTYTTPQLLTISDAAPGAVIYYSTNGYPPEQQESPIYTSPIAVSASETVQAIAIAPGYGNSPVASATYNIVPPTVPTEDVIYSFLPAGDLQASQPKTGLISDAAGNLYGTTQAGGGGFNGSVFELVAGTGGTWTEKLLYSFGGSPDGNTPLGGLVFDKNGNLYGTTSAGGTLDDGTVFELTPTTSGPWTETILHNFDYLTNDGVNPSSGLIFDASGNLYGTTENGGANSSGDANPGGTVFELSPGTGGVWTETILHSFYYLNTSDGYYPLGGVVFDTKGNLYGTTSDGGPGQDNEGGGTVYELSPAGGATWTETILHGFGGCADFCTDGYLPKGGVVLDSAGNVYGTASVGSPNGYGNDGMVFELTPGAGNTWTESIVHNFGAYETDGVKPQSGLAIDGGGNLYGTTLAGGVYRSGTVFELSPESGGWTESILHSFDLNGADGASPYDTPLLASNGNIYGTTFAGGANGDGTVFELISSATALPVFTPPAGNYGSAQSVELSDPTPEAVIYYTTNGTAPSTSSTKYTTAISVTANMTIKALATAVGHPQSGVASASYQFYPSAMLTSPTQGSTFAGPSATFTWATVPGATSYELVLGSTGVGSNNLWSSGSTTVLSITFGALPTNGERIYVRLYTTVSGVSVHNDYTFTAASQGVLTSPTPGSTLPGPNVKFTWAPGTAATSYTLWLGSTGVGSNNIWGSGATTATSITFGAMPVNGETIYVRLYTVLNGASVHIDYTLTAATAGILSSPTPGILSGPSVYFAWPGASSTATSYTLWLGSTGVGSNNIWGSGATTATSITFGAMPTNGETIYARLYTILDGYQVHVDYTFTAASQGVITSPVQGATFTGPSVQFKWSAGTPFCYYTLWLGSTGVGSNNLWSSGVTEATSITFGGMPTNGEKIYARLYTNINGYQVHADYTYTAATQAVMMSPTESSTLPGPSVTFTWTGGSAGATYDLWLGTTVGNNNIWGSGARTTTSVTFNSMPTNGETIYARLYTTLNGVSVHNDYTYTAASQAVLTTPAPGGFLFSTSETFDWSAGSGTGTQYQIVFGSTGVGSSDLGSSPVLTTTSYTFNNVPGTIETMYVRLFTKLNGTWVYTDYTYTTG